MSHLQVAVLRGGPSVEYPISMRTGAAVLAALAENGFETKDIIITKQGEWLDRGRARTPDQALQAIDVVFVALHGTYGEDGEVQKILQRLNIPFTGSSSFASAVAFNKGLTKKHLATHDILMPMGQEVSIEDIDEVARIANQIQENFGPEYIIKPVSSGSSFGIDLVPLGHSLENALQNALQKNERVMVEEFIRGKEATCGALEDYRNEELYIFPSIEIIPPRDSRFFDTEAKYNGKSTEICPARFSYAERVAIADATALIHESLHLTQYSRSDFVLGDRGIYFLEVNTLPGLTAESLYPKSAAAVGLDLRGLVQHLVETATC